MPSNQKPKRKPAKPRAPSVERLCEVFYETAFPEHLPYSVVVSPPYKKRYRAGIRAVLRELKLGRKG